MGSQRVRHDLANEQEQMEEENDGMIQEQGDRLSQEEIKGKEAESDFKEQAYWGGGGKEWGE